jgi:glycosyltransferase involved in cell wall biosynthesis
MSKRLIIIPAYNEKENLSALRERLEPLRSAWDVLVVDDGSIDGSSDWLREHHLPFLRMPINTGIGGAMHAGYAWAWRHGYEYALQLDADGQHPPEEVEKLVREMEQNGADLVIGSRFKEASAYQAGWARGLGIRLFRLVIRLLTDRTVYDPTSGFRLANRRTIQFFHRYYPPDFPEVETVFCLLLGGYRVCETAVHMQPRQFGRTTINALQSIFYMIKVPFAIGLHYVAYRTGGMHVQNTPDNRAA